VIIGFPVVGDSKFGLLVEGVPQKLAERGKEY